MSTIDHSNDLIECPICHVKIKNLSQLASHLVVKANESEAQHVMWLNRFVTKDRVDKKQLHRLLTNRSTGQTQGRDTVQR